MVKAMDRGFGGYYRGTNNQTFRRDDRRHDDFYSDRDRRGSSGNFGGRGNRGSSRDQAFFGQQGNQSGQNSVIAALQLQNQSLVNAFIRNSQSRGSNFHQQRKGYQGSGFRPGEKRRQESSSGPSGFKRSKNSNKSNAGTQKRSSSSSSSSVSRKKDNSKAEVKEEEVPDIPDDQVEIPDSLMDNVEKLRQRKEVERNVADEDVDKLVVFCFNGKGYQCLTCGLLLTKDVAFKQHLMAKGHVMNVIDARSAKKYQETRDVLDIDLQPDGWYEKSDKARKIILKQAKLIMKIDIEKKKREEENYNKNPRNFFDVNMFSKKTATIKEDTLRITSIVESAIDVKEFSKDRFFGCEFVKAVASFQCRLCDMKIYNPTDVIAHIDSRVHRNKYQMHLKKNPDYEKSQKEQNKELCVILNEHEGNPVLLSESTTYPQDEDREKTLIDELNSCLVRVPEILNPPEKDPKEEETGEENEAKDNEEKADETKKENEESTHDDATGKSEDEKGPQEEPMETDGDAKEKEEEENEDQTEKNDQKKNEPSEETTNEEKADETVEEPVDTEEKSTNEEKSEQSSTDNTEKTEVNNEVEEEEKTDAEKVKKATPKKPRGGTAKRGTGRSRGGSKVSPAPRSTRRKKDVTETETKEDDQQTNEENAGDGNFMDGFQVVDEVQEE